MKMTIYRERMSSRTLRFQKNCFIITTPEFICNVEKVQNIVSNKERKREGKCEEETTTFNS